MAGNKRVAIIIVNFNGRAYLPDCLGSLHKLAYPADDYRIFFVDNASSDDSVDYVKNNFPQVVIISNRENLGFAGGNNAGMAKALQENYDYVFLINQDTVSDPGVLTQLVNFAEQDEKIGALQPRLMLYPAKDKINSLGNAIHYLGFGFSLGSNQNFSGEIKPQEIAYASGAALLIKCSALAAVGLFEPEFFMYHEDFDLGWRLRLAGYKIFVLPEAVVYHKYEFSRSIRKYYYMERNRFICLLANYKIATLLVIGPALIVMEIGLFLFSLKSGFWREKIKVYRYFLRPASWRYVANLRKKTQSLRAVKDKKIVRLFIGKIEFQEINNFVLNKIANPVFNLYWQIIKLLIIW
jgi:GT2 family glycosyltransferase